jgi:spore coat protein CotF
MPTSTNNNDKLRDKDILQDSLIMQKHMTSSYNTFAGECVDPQLRTAMLNILNDEHKIQAELFSTIQSHGWYQTEQAQQQKIQQTKQKFSCQCGEDCYC